MSLAKSWLTLRAAAERLGGYGRNIGCAASFKTAALYTWTWVPVCVTLNPVSQCDGGVCRGSRRHQQRLREFRAGLREGTMATAVGLELLQLSGLLRSPGLTVFQAWSVREYLHPTLSIWLGKLEEAEKSQLACGLPGHHVRLSHNPQGTRACTQSCTHRHIRTGTRMRLSHCHSLRSTCRLARVHRYTEIGST